MRELKRRMTRREFVWWKALFKISPFDDERCYDAPAARVALQVNRTGGGRADFEAFMPFRYRPSMPEPTAEDPSAGLRGYFQSFNRS